ncbi:winged helix-turn-helix domain-containing protein [Halostagnicola sp. A56]|uniref:winged helix-turn-helix domain-containing protein n=1 Tax=Halostagnicola sp. A56 TaxID=1495067 RepID=UPI0018CDCA78|nr:winged helix-turn-helix domain-containing protein [Halostagnicola sp. A56]
MVDDTTLTDVLGDHPKVKILTALLGESDRDLNTSDLARLAGIERSTVYDHIDVLRAYGLVEQTRTVGNSKMYQLNKENEAAKALGKFDWALTNILAEKEEAGELPGPPTRANTRTDSRSWLDVDRTTTARSKIYSTKARFPRTSTSRLGHGRHSSSSSTDERN